MKTVHVIMDCDLRPGHKGLFLTAKRTGVDIRTLGDGEAVLFVNRKRTKVKAYSSNGVLSYAHFDNGITLSSFDIFPDAVVSGMKMEWSSRIKKEIVRVLNGLPVERGVSIKESKPMSERLAA